MKPSVDAATVRFRAPEALIAQALAKAEREGMTLSEFIRHAVRREVQQPAR